MELVAELLRGCPQVQIPATSRKALAVPGEVHYHVQPLALPPLQRGRPLLAAEVEHFDAIQLFIDRARLALPGFALTDHNATPVAAICQRLDGIPLGIELGRLPGSICCRRCRWPTILRRGLICWWGAHGVAAPPNYARRHRLELSVAEDPERTLLRRLTVFAGGWTLAAAMAVVAATVEG